MSRFPPIPPDQLTPEQKKGHDEMDYLAQKTFGSTFTMKNNEGALIGPFAPLLYTPSLASPWLDLSHKVIICPLLTPRERELACFAVLSRTKTAYTIYAHTSIAERLGLTATQISDALSGIVPTDLNERESVTYKFALQLVEMRGPMEAEKFEAAKAVLGREEVAAVMHTVGSFLYSSVLMNAADVPVPEKQ
ncbi:hypothetical protein AJ79_04558 [Helicocarpus griseus UAMH5409]|uniref:Carboxymuconolactone decarboxylase-like domain-containing protein n=1 Tax=Helicocarpus griseus UAMH5409 TaxID=1447875 RepID=A0A2B7XT79_9EURO|nr:hypothetical protein AJ79_04558 [Helicocarpus griseus UAMH5409]